MTGSLQIKGNIYYAVLNIPDDAGKPHPKWISLKLRVDKVKKREAQKVFRNLLKQYEDSQVAYAKDVLFTDWLGSVAGACGLVCLVFVVLAAVFYAMRRRLVVNPLAAFLAKLFLDPKNKS